MTITSHVLDTARGRPAHGLRAVLERQHGDSWVLVTEARADVDGRLGALTKDADLPPGIYRLVFDTKAYFDAQQTPTFYPHIVIVFATVPGEAHYHVPLLVSPFGYTTYRGS